MSLEEITKTVSDYQDLIQLARERIQVLEKVNKEYNTENGIEFIEIDEESVYVRYDDSCCGDRSSSSFDFPTKWLSVSEEEMTDIVVMEKERRAEALREAARLAKLETDRIKQEKELMKEKEDRKLYKELKAKFEK